ncbi:Phage protein [Lactococcus lactis subsp. lactis]|uniref:DUF1359 domain-containing protein n=2 Tax=Lactococcus lactis TaxID=1358 RepID=A0A2A5S9D0_LACLH|nr:DUF1359 domain-containing protein [Lactococcus lactis]KAA8703980.1 DUF1359 domain-containing protein [Lactococcus lactis subsp. hordniae]KSU09210.1 Phage protein [Lactococcus lactis subsp. lactis]MCT3135246.1 DUF1359 domain-containing protein [Lactococcus lactis]PCS10055.1 hypothetical protein RU90_GL001592 [Lactococcus lactis subsp. hordniae]
MLEEITVDFSEQVAETQTKIDRLQGIIYDIENQKNVLDDCKKSHIPRDTKFELSLSGVLRCSVKISIEMLIPLLEQNIEDNTVLIHKLAKELGIAIK